MTIIKRERGKMPARALKKPKEPTLHDHLCQRAVRWLKKKGFSVVASEIVCNTPTGEVPDAIGWRETTSALIEVKTSRSDFLADAKKPFRKHPEQGMGRWRFYLCPPGVIVPEDLPPGWGLIYAKGRSFEDVYGVPTNVFWHTENPFVCNEESEKYLLLSVLRRIQNDDPPKAARLNKKPPEKETP